MAKRKLSTLFAAGQLLVLFLQLDILPVQSDVTTDVNPSDSSLRYVDTNRAYFNASHNTYITLPNTLDLRRLISFSFRTCSYGSLLRAGSADSYFRIDLTPEGHLKVSWQDGGASGSGPDERRHSFTVENSTAEPLNTNQWYTIDVRFNLGQIYLTVEQGARLMHQVLMSNSSYQTYLQDIDLAADSAVTVGRGYTGCFQGGASLMLNQPHVKFGPHPVELGSCPLEDKQGCDTEDEDPCWSYPCQNGGTCHRDESVMAGYTCDCPLEYSGANCDIDQGYLACELNPCQNDAECFTVENSTRKYYCVCPPGYTGVRCDINIDECMSKPCHNGALCTDLIDGYYCNCTGTGFEGSQCERNIDECAIYNPCHSNSTCIDTPGSYKCICPLGFGGKHCEDEVDECMSNPCQNSARCEDLAGMYRCICLPGFTGTHCEVDIDDCAGIICDGNNTMCVDGIDTYICECRPGYVFSSNGVDCVNFDECLSSPCLNGGTCLDGPGLYLCQCLPGFTGYNCQTDIDECEDVTCQNGAKCIDDVNSFRCLCLPGYTDELCSTEINECDSDPCLNGATCLDHLGRYECQCPAGYTGVHCELNIDDCLEGPCQNGARCEDILNGYICHCLPGFTGVHCERHARSVNFCDLQPCQNGATCVPMETGYYCQCTDDWMGKNCTEVYDACALMPCLNGGTCSSTPPSHYKVCTCPVGFTGLTCQTNIDDCAGVTCPPPKICVDGINNYTCQCPVGFTGDACDIRANDCANMPCQNGGKCIPEGESYRCECVGEWVNHTAYTGDKDSVYWIGYTGTNCEIDVQECDLSPPICLNGGLCKPQTTTEYGFKCYCPNGGGDYFTGKYCQDNLPYCTIVNQRDPPVCYNDGKCEDVGETDFRCYCEPGFMGQRCETNIDECESNPCLNNGTCIDGRNEYTCVCLDGFTGPDCSIDINECSSNPCLNGGQCTDVVAGFVCNCTGTGFEGDLCELDVNECLFNPCQHGATCVNLQKGPWSEMGYRCDCYPGYTGVNCEIDIDECSSGPCKNNGTCLENSDQTQPWFDFSTAEGYRCECVKGFTGDSCEVNINDCEPGHSCVYGHCVDGINSYVCACDPGYMGVNCDVEIDECSLFAPCQFGAQCIDKIADYDCICAGGYGGKNCSVPLTGCDLNGCQNGVCVPTLLSEDPPLHSYYCRCPPGISGQFCEKNTTTSFFGSSWLRYDGTDGVADLDLSLSFQTTLPDGLLMVSAKKNADKDAYDYVLLQLIGGSTIRVDYINTGQEQFVLSVSTGTSLVDGVWHQVNVTIRNTGVTLVLYHDDCARGECIDTRPRSDPPASNHTLGQTWFGGQEFGLDFLSGVANFTGCMRDIRIFNTVITPEDYIANVSVSKSIAVGCARVEQCTPDPCNSHGKCTDLWFEYNCSCWRPYLGEHCEQEHIAGTFGYESSSSRAEFNLSSTTELDLKVHNDLSLFFRTRKPTGLIFYIGAANGDTYMATDLFNGRLRIRVKLGSKEKICIQFPGYVANGDQYFLRVVRQNDKLKYWVQQTGKGDPTVTLDSASHDCDVQPFDMLLKPEVFYIGGFPGASSMRVRRDLPADTDEFKGTIQDIRQNGWLAELFPRNDTDMHTFGAPELVNVLQGEQSDDMCSLYSPCVNNATCENVFFNDYRCLCTEGFRGKNCSELDFCVSNHCPGNATCNNLEDGYECVTTATFNGLSSYNQYSNTINSSVDIKTLFAEFRTRETSAILLHIRGSNTFADSYITLEIAADVLTLTFDLGDKSTLTLPVNVTDGEWHNVSVVVETGGFILELDGIHETAKSNLTNAVTLYDLVRATDDVYAAGVPGSYLTGHADMFQTDSPLKGCLGAVRIGGLLLPFFNRSELENDTSSEVFYAAALDNVVIGCHGDPVCASDRCEHGSTCVDIWNAYLCDCNPGYKGRFCEVDIDECVDNECQNNATCVDGIANYTCQCAPGYTGYLCDIDINECESSPCLNNGTCIDQVAGYECNCTTNYTGINCEIDIRENCEMNPDLCNNGTCITVNTTIEGVTTFNCSCPPGYTGRYCESEIDYCENDPCLNNATCQSVTALLNYTCLCVEGYTGRDCEIEIDECDSSPCQNNATCLDYVARYECQCQTGWHGVNCDLDIDECNMTDSNYSIPCQHGQCVNLPGSYLCNCTGSGYEGVHCENDVDECLDEMTCQNNATCHNTEGGYYCNCTLGYEGKHCEIANCSYGQCLNGGTCNIDGGGQWYCDCLPFIEGFQCQSPGPCVEAPCENNATCSQSGNSYTCICQSGWEGVNCTEDINECEVYAPCQNNATCTNLNGSYSCLCVPGFTDFNCSTDIDECASSPCQNGGQCLDQINSYYCDCTDTGYEGTECQTDIDECLASPCQHGGTCLNSPGSYNCTCTIDYVGTNCQTPNPCLEDYCLNGGSCYYEIDDNTDNATAFCTCVEPWQGPQCEFTSVPMKKEEDNTLAVVLGVVFGGLILIVLIVLIVLLVIFKEKRATRGTYSPSRQETIGSRVELGNVLKQPPMERLI